LDIGGHISVLNNVFGITYSFSVKMCYLTYKSCTICNGSYVNNYINREVTSIIEANKFVFLNYAFDFSELSKFYLKTNSYYGIGNLSLYSNNISCTGKERTLEECRHTYTDNEACSNNDIVGVACKGMF
jgi:hypothetical protein